MKHPEHAQHLWRRPCFRTRRSLLLLGPLVFAPPAATWPLRAGVAALVRTGWTSSGSANCSSRFARWSTCVARAWPGGHCRWAAP
jgi:hypothetical protein